MSPERPADPPATDGPADAFVRWASDHFAAPVTHLEPATTRSEGFDSEIHLVRLAGPGLPAQWRGPLVLRVLADADRLADGHREAGIQDWLAGHGYPAPRVLHVFAPGELVDRPVQVMERAPGALLLDDLLRRPWTARRLIGRLARLQARLHQLPTEGFPDTDDLLDRRLRLPRNIVATVDDPDLRRGLDRIETLASRLRDAPPSVCHGDFHPLNVLAKGDTTTVIDWTDSGLGDRHGDLARTLLLFEMASIAANSPVERALLSTAGPMLGRIHRRTYGRLAPVDDHRLRLWRPVHLLHSWAQARAGNERAPAGAAEALQGRFEAAIAALPEHP